jgi:purine catabolism regulator
MAVTVGEVIELPIVQRGSPEVLSKGRWSDPIRWLHVGEVAELPSLLQGGELVLTTGVGLGRAPRRYLQGLADAKALGVVIELGAAMPSISNSLATLARELDLTLVVLHRKIRFVEVTEAVHRKIVAAQYDEVSFDRRVHATFTELSMKRASASAIVDAAASMLDEPVVLEDLAHQALAVSASNATTASLLEEWDRRSRLAPTADGGAEQWVVTPVGPRGEEWGRLIVPRPPADRGRALMVLERAAAALAMHRMVERNRTGLHQQAQSGLIDDVLQGRITDDREATARARALGLGSARRYYPVVIRVEGRSGGAGPVDTQRRNTALLDAAAHAVNAAGHSGVFAIRGDGEIGLILALRAGRGAADRALGALGEVLRRDLMRLNRANRPVCAVAQPAGEVADAIRGHAEAAHIAEAALAMGDTTRPFYSAADVRLRGVIALLRDDPRVQQFAETELRALVASDLAGDGISNVDLLRHYLQLAGNKAALAQRLHISRPTLYRRLATIAEILGVDLEDAESITSLHVAMLILDARRIPSAGSTGLPG